MIKTDMRASPFCLTEAFFWCLSDEDQAGGEARLLEWSRQGRMPEYCKIGSQRNKAHWSRSAIYQWFKNRYGVVRPDLLQKLIDTNAGFEAAPPPVSWTQNRAQKKKASRVKK